MHTIHSPWPWVQPGLSRSIYVTWTWSVTVDLHALVDVFVHEVERQPSWSAFRRCRQTNTTSLYTSSLLAAGRCRPIELPSAFRVNLSASRFRRPKSTLQNHNICILSLWHIWRFLAKATCTSNFHEKTCTNYLRKFCMMHVQVEQQKLQDKKSVSWALLCCDSDWPITAHRLRKKTFRNRTRSISKSWLSHVKTCASVYAKSES